MKYDPAGHAAYRDVASYRALHIVNAALFIGLWVFTIAAYAQLPEQVPQHMGPGGEVNRWGHRGIWFLVPLMISVQLVIVYGLSSAVKTAQGMNMPHKKRVLALPRDAQTFVLVPMRGFLFGIATGMLVLTIGIQIEFFIASHRGYGTALILPLVALLLLIMFGGMWWLNRRIASRLDAVEAALARRDRHSV